MSELDKEYHIYRKYDISKGRSPMGKRRYRQLREFYELKGLIVPLKAPATNICYREGCTNERYHQDALCSDCQIKQLEKVVAGAENIKGTYKWTKNMEEKYDSYKRQLKILKND